MRKISLAMFMALCAHMGATYAQDSGVTMSTDPARAADIEQRAQDLQSQQESPVRSGLRRHQKHHIGSQPGSDQPADTGFDLANPRGK